MNPQSIPNLLGVFRIVATPLLVALILWGTAWSYFATFVLLLLMAISDIADGRLARKYGVVSPLGVFLDTTSDKIFVTAVLIPLVQQGLLSSWIAVVIIVRDFAISGLRSYAAAEGVIISARPWGKQKLTITVLALCWLLLWAAAAETPGVPPVIMLLLSLWWIPMAMAVIWTVGSGLEYIWNAWPLLMGKQPPAEPAAKPARTWHSTRRPSLASLSLRRRSRPAHLNRKASRT